MFTDKDDPAPPPPYEEVCSMPGHQAMPTFPPPTYGKDKRPVLLKSCSHIDFKKS